MLVYLNTTLNTGHAHGLAEETIILPVLARDEEPQPTTQESMFSYVRLSDGGPARHAGPAQRNRDRRRSGGPRVGRRRTRSTGAKCVKPVAFARRSPRSFPVGKRSATSTARNRSFQIAGRRLDTPQFPTASGRANLLVDPLPEPSCGDGELRLMTVRSEGQFNTVVYEEYDLYRGQDRRDIVLVHPSDLARLGLANESKLTVRSRVGR